jgi:hypothetical protein
MNPCPQNAVIDGISGRSFTIELVLDHDAVSTIEQEDEFVKYMWQHFEESMPSVWTAHMTSSFYKSTNANVIETWRNPCLISIDMDQIHWVWDIGAAVSKVMDRMPARSARLPASVTVNYSLKDGLDMQHGGEPSMIYYCSTVVV